MPRNLGREAIAFEAAWRKTGGGLVKKEFGAVDILSMVVPVPGIGSITDVARSASTETIRAKKIHLVNRLLADPLLREAVRRTTRNAELQTVIQNIRKREMMEQSSVRRNLPRARRPATIPVAPAPARKVVARPPATEKHPLLRRRAA